MMQFLYPVPASSVITQTYDQHVARAKANGWSWAPGVPGNGYYYGGIDYGIPTGTPVEAAQSGTVAEARKDSTGYGWHIRLQHAENWLSIYGHLSKLLVQKGQTVKVGDVIGLSGNTGNSTGPHLHFELRKNGTPVDPKNYLVSVLDDDDEEEPEPVPSGLCTIKAHWNLRAGPGTNTTDLGTTDAAVSAEVVENQGDWVKVRMVVWVHKDAIA